MVRAYPAVAGLAGEKDLRQGSVAAVPIQTEPLDEHLAGALTREAAEEVGLTIRHDKAYLVTTVHYRNPEQQARLGFFFHVTSQPSEQGEPFNAEPHKCAKIGWYQLDMLPANTVPYTTAGIKLFRAREAVGFVGW